FSPIHLRSRDIRRERWIGENPDIEGHHLLPGREDALAHELVLGALRIAGADEKDLPDRRFVAHCPSCASSVRSVDQGASVDMSMTAGPSNFAGDRIARKTSVSSPAL